MGGVTRKSSKDLDLPVTDRTSYLFNMRISRKSRVWFVVKESLPEGLGGRLRVT